MGAMKLAVIWVIAIAMWGASDVLDSIFLVVVGLVLWFSVDTWEHNKAQALARDQRGIDMETIDGPRH